jgi:negative regulator of flagellin synthesis FlgM
MTIDIHSFGGGRPDGIRRNGNDKSIKADSSIISTSSTEATTETTGKPGASVSLSDAARNLAQIESELKGLPEIDQQRVDAIRTMLSEGRYQVDFERLAQRMLDLES